MWKSVAEETNLKDAGSPDHLVHYKIGWLMATFDTGGEVDFHKDILSFLSPKDGQHSPLKVGNSLFS
jgi:hypothetical protein